MASNNHRASADNTNAPQDTIVNGDNKEESDHLMAPHHTHHTSQQSRTVYASIQQGQTFNDEGNMLQSVANPEQSISRARQVREAKDFPYTRARVASLAIIFFYMVSVVCINPLETQYFHHRFTPDFFNESAASHSTGSDALSNCKGKNSSHLASDEAALQAKVAKFRMYLSYAGLGPMMIATVVFGSLSDVVGRRKLFLLPCISMTAKQVIWLVAVKLELPLWVFYVANVVDGFSGSFCALFLAGFAYTADITTAGKARTLGMTLAEASITSAVMGQLAVGYILQDYGFFYGCLGPTACVGCAAFIALFCLPETIPDRGRHSTTPTCVNPFLFFKNVFGFYIFDGSIKQRLLFCLQLLVMLIDFTLEIGYTVVLTLFQLNLPFCWSPEQVGLYGALSKLGTTVAGLCAMPLLQKRLSDLSIIAVGLMSFLAQFVLNGLATNDLMLYLVPVAGGLYLVTSAAGRAMLSKMAGTDKQGALFASVAVVETAGTFTSMTLYNSVYEATVAHMRGAVFFVMAGLALVAMGPVLILRRLLGRTDDQNYEKIIESNRTTETSRSHT